MGRMGVEAAMEQLERLVRLCEQCGCHMIPCACGLDDLDGLWLSDYSVDEVETDTVLNELSIIDQQYY